MKRKNIEKNNICKKKKQTAETAIIKHKERFCSSGSHLQQLYSKDLFKVLPFSESIIKSLIGWK